MRLTTHTWFALIIVFGGCSFGMRGVDPSWDGASDPDCTSTHVPVLIDAATAIATSSIVAELVGTDPPLVEPAVLIAGAAASLLYTISAVQGSAKYKACRQATASWQVREAVRSRVASRTGKQPSRTPLQRDWPEVAGYYCTRSASRVELSTCALDRAACEQARVGFPAADGLPCALRRSAWCFHGQGAWRCFASDQMCEARREAAAVGAIQCVERWSNDAVH